MTGLVIRFTGRVGRDPDRFTLADGTLMLAFGVAVRDDLARPGPRTTWVRCAAFGALAEQLAGALAKGDAIECVGRLVVKLYDAAPDLEAYLTDAAPRPDLDSTSRRHDQAAELVQLAGIIA